MLIIVYCWTIDEVDCAESQQQQILEPNILCTQNNKNEYVEGNEEW